MKQEDMTLNDVAGIMQDGFECLRKRMDEGFAQMDRHFAEIRHELHITRSMLRHSAPAEES